MSHVLLNNALHADALLSVFELFLVIKIYNLELKSAMATANIAFIFTDHFIRSIQATIQSDNHVAAAQCINSCRYR